MADIQLNSVTLATESSGTITLDSATVIPAAGITGTMASGVTGIPAAGVTGTLGSSVGFPTGHVVKVTSFDITPYSISCPDAAANKSNYVQLGSLSWDVVLKQANSTILIIGYFSMGGFGSHGYFDLYLDSTTWLGAHDGLHADHKNSADDKHNVSVNHWHNPGTNAATTTLNYKPYVGQWSGTETVQINRYASNNSNGDITSQFSFLELGV